MNPLDQVMSDATDLCRRIKGFAHIENVELKEAIQIVGYALQMQNNNERAAAMIANSLDNMARQLNRVSWSIAHHDGMSLAEELHVGLTKISDGVRTI